MRLKTQGPNSDFIKHLNGGTYRNGHEPITALFRHVLHDACAAKEQAFGDVKVPAESVHAAFMAALGSAYAELTTTREFTGNP